VGVPLQALMEPVPETGCWGRRSRGLQEAHGGGMLVGGGRATAHLGSTLAAGAYKGPAETYSPEAPAWAVATHALAWGPGCSYMPLWSPPGPGAVSGGWQQHASNPTICETVKRQSKYHPPPLQQGMVWLAWAFL
jgi:hypothetical protein